MLDGYTTCGCCGRNMKKAQAVADGKGYCRTCYKREFKPVTCQKCGKDTKTLGGVPAVDCWRCRNAGKPCKRCGNVRRAALVLDDGSIVCNACRRWFVEPKPCAHCGELSIHLARNLNDGITEPICPKCIRKSLKQCPLCLKKQWLGHFTADGLRVCSLCASSGKTFICSQCGEANPRHKKTCLVCHLKNTTKKKLETLLPTFTHEWARVHFAGLIRELLNDTKDFKATVKLKQYYSIFKKLDDHFDRQERIDTDAIAEIFGRGRFALFTRITGYLVTKKVVSADFIERLKASDIWLGQKNFVAMAKGEWYERVIANYHIAQMKKHETYRNKGWEGEHIRFSMRTIRQNLAGGIQFLKSLPDNVNTVAQIHQGHIDAFLSGKPGYRNVLRAFIRYLNKHEKMFQPLKVEHVTRNPLPPHLVIGQEKYLSLLKTWLYPDDATLKESIICLFMLLYLQRGKTIARLRLIDIIERDGCFGFPFGETDVMLDSRISSLLRRYLEQRHTVSVYDDARSNPYLFPGKSYKGHMGITSMSAIMKKYQVTEAQLFSTGILKMFQNGVDAPKAVELLTGINSKTAYRYYILANPRLKAETNAYLGGER